MKSTERKSGHFASNFAARTQMPQVRDVLRKDGPNAKQEIATDGKGRKRDISCNKLFGAYSCAVFNLNRVLELARSPNLAHPSQRARVQLTEAHSGPRLSLSRPWCELRSGVLRSATRQTMCDLGLLALDLRTLCGKQARVVGVRIVTRGNSGENQYPDHACGVQRTRLFLRAWAQFHAGGSLAAVAALSVNSRTLPDFACFFLSSPFVSMAGPQMSIHNLGIPERCAQRPPFVA